MSDGTPPPFLDVRNVHTYYGSIHALKGIDLHVNRGEVVTLIGANGAGKSTLMMAICGVMKVSTGDIIYDDLNITNMPVHKITHRKIAQVPEGRRIFPRMTVMENLQMGAAVDDYIHFEEDLHRIFDLFPILAKRQTQRGGTLSGGEQQMLAIGRALMSRPRLLLLDEPSLGLAPIIIRQIFSIIRDINTHDNLTVFLVEQNIFHALKLADRAYVMVNGHITMTGIGQELLERDDIRAAYLDGNKH